jgi:hypothetical protein
MKVYHCDHCSHLLFFESTECVACTHRLAYLPDLALVGSLDAGPDDTWRSPRPAAAGRVYRLCQNYREHKVCNWAVAGDDDNPLCLSCRLTRIIPDLGPPEHRLAWYRLEAAKRRLVFTLMRLNLAMRNNDDDAANGLTFEFKADTGSSDGRVLTGHANGVITINIAEADDVERERRRKSVHEPYRTLLGHFRHESGHYYWDRLIKNGPHIERYRALFGDERADYDDALKAHYATGASQDWREQFISAYATAHSWEDWAETWAHYLHMVDTLETTAASGMSLKPKRPDEPSLAKLPASIAAPGSEFDDLIDAWFPITYVLNNLNRGMGLPDAYPFVLSSPAIEKLRFVHEVVAEAARAASDPSK